MKKIKNPIKPNLYDKVIASIKQHKPRYLESGLNIPKDIENGEAHRVHIVQIRSIKTNPQTLESEIIATPTSYDVRTWLNLKQHLADDKYYVIHDPSEKGVSKPKAKKEVKETKEAEDVEENEATEYLNTDK